MQEAIDQFRANIRRVRNLGALYKAMSAQTTQALDLSDLLRAQLVTAVSALDHFVHEVVRFGMLQTYRNKRKPTRAFLQFSIAVESVQQALANPSSDDWLESEIRARHGWRSFQQADKVTEAVRLVSDVKLWEEVGGRLGKPPQDIKQQLNLIVDRRNKIAHEADIDPTFPGRRWPINEVLVNQAIDFVELVVEAIHSIL
ncbi:MAG TPA: HEPN domain-containing protein [Terriglobia bacterium]|nr:HEPN domain-containing protein [Terriglobia bacterium]